MAWITAHPTLYCFAVTAPSSPAVHIQRLRAAELAALLLQARTSGYCGATPSAMNTRLLAELCRSGLIASYAGELSQATAFSTLSKTSTTKRPLGASPSTGVTLPPRTKYLPLKGAKVPGTAAPYFWNVVGSLTSSSAMTYPGPALTCCARIALPPTPPIATPAARAIRSL